jgi:hypothetical protein
VTFRPRPPRVGVRRNHWQRHSRVNARVAISASLVERTGYTALLTTAGVFLSAISESK